MIWIGLAALAILGLIILAAVREVGEYSQENSVQPQCTPSRPCYTARPSKRLRWFGLERSLQRDRIREIREEHR
jgi:hypothetical protein